ncbi:monocarboxylate transporter 9-like [Acanthaster planci]|uniref:Monocarboxylate transporter 9-like n=1 Tax=Acanthaster planci TaxID=133434 RepID=A0A8B7Z7U9_ACAPL|nr:monocarboxylate transporter 9-like [Acanthaster planci]
MACCQPRCGWWRWLIPWLVFVEFFLCFGILYNYNILFVSLQGEFHSGSAVTGWVGSLSHALVGLASPLTPLLERKLSRRVVVLTGVTTICAGLFMTSFVPALGYAYLTFGVLTGVGGSFMTNSSLGLLMDWFVGRNFSRYSATVFMGSNCGVLSLSYLLTAATNHYGWRGALRVFSGGILVVGAAAGLLLTDPPADECCGTWERGGSRDQKQCGTNSVVTMMEQTPACGMEETEDSGIHEPLPTDDKDSEDVKTEVAGEEASDAVVTPDKLAVADAANSHRLFVILKDPEAWLWSVASLLSFMGWAFFNINFASFMKGLRFDDNQIASNIVFFSCGELGGKILLAMIGDRLPFMYLYVVVASCLGGTVTLSLLAYSKTYTTVAVLGVVSGVCRTGVYGACVATAAQLFHRTYGTRGSLILFMYPAGFGTFVSALLAGVLYDLTGDYLLSLIVIVVIFLCATTILLVIPLRRRIRSRGYAV